MEKINGLLNPKHAPIKLHAEDHEDLHLLSAHLQDAFIPVSGLTFHQNKQRFHLLANRFRWELEEEEHEEAPLYYRTHCNLSFGHIQSVKHKGFPQAHPTHVLYLLAIRGHEDGTISFHCSDGAAIRLTAEKIFCRMADVGEHWPTRNRPQHNGHLI